MTAQQVVDRVLGLVFGLLNYWFALYVAIAVPPERGPPSTLAFFVALPLMLGTYAIIKGSKS